MTMREPTINELYSSFRRLERALKKVCLPLDEKNCRYGVPSDEFMLMSIDSNNNVHFKHEQSRNYLILTLDDKLVVPQYDKPKDAFMKGFFEPVLFPSKQIKGINKPKIAKSDMELSKILKIDYKSQL